MFWNPVHAPPVFIHNGLQRRLFSKHLTVHASHRSHLGLCTLATGHMTVEHAWHRSHLGLCTPATGHMTVEHAGHRLHDRCARQQPVTWQLSTPATGHMTVVHANYWSHLGHMLVIGGWWTVFSFFIIVAVDHFKSPFPSFIYSLTDSITLSLTPPSVCSVIGYYFYLKCNFPMNPHVLLLDGRLVCLVGKLHFHAPKKSILLSIHMHVLYIHVYMKEYASDQSRILVAGLS